MTGRRVHTKTRNGCVPCKLRKVKCGEEKPICKNCSRREENCTYRNPPRSGILSAPTPSSSTTSAPASFLPSGTSSPSHREKNSNTTPRSETRQNDDDDVLNLWELELLHNYCTSTCYTISQNPLLQTVWRVNVPRIGFSSEFVMRSILAISALHLAYCNPSKREFYTAKALTLHEKALRAANKVLLNITEENCSSFYLLTALTCIITCAKSPNANDLFVLQDSGLSDWFKLFRGTRSIVHTYQHALHSGPLGGMFKIGHRRTMLRDSLPMAAPQPLVELKRYVFETVEDVSALQAYSTAIDELSMSLNLTLNGENSNINSHHRAESSEVFIWLFRVSEEYMTLLSSRAPEALVIFGYYCVLLKQLEWAWWMRGWSMHLVARIYYSVDHEYRSWMQWPIEQVGWIPTEEDSKTPTTNNTPTQTFR